ncbi:MAG: 4-hydroxy-tetrahydrodipicolinate reductase [Clostridiales bacterium]|nr:4-hydroxy-tetrahydrodipicolinate reductase [Clostridiales bacterium]
MVNVLIHGANGRMGKKVFEACALDQDVKAVCGIDLIENLNNPDFPVYSSFSAIKEKVDVIVDFSAPASLDNILAYAVANSCPAVLCATGYTDEQAEKIKSASEKVAIFRSGNMSLGVNLLIDLVKKAAEVLYGFDVEIIEKHHNQKVDAPSGTALMLANAVKDVQEDKFFTYGREGIVGKRDAKEIGIHAVRGGNIVGEHDVIFAGNFETVTISHQATDRSVFAQGAVAAAKFLAKKKVGLFNMNDVINGK